MLILGNGTVITLNDKNEVLENSAVLCKNGFVHKVGKTTDIRKEFPEAEYIDANNKIILPGFINVHTHLYSTFARGISLSSEPACNFVETLEKLWWKLDNELLKEDVYYSALFALVECIKNGTTTIIDHHESQGFQKGAIYTIAEALNLSGVRGCLTLGASDRYGKSEEGLNENVSFIKELGSLYNNSIITAMMGLHASFTVSDVTLNKCSKFAQDLGVGVHVHVAEDLADQKHCLENYNMRVVERLKKANLLGPLSLAVHCIHLNNDEINILKDSGTMVVHNPQSNMNNAVGSADVLGMIKQGLKVGLGTDAMTHRMTDELKAAYLLHRHDKGDPRVAFMESCDMLIKINPDFAERLFKIKSGVIKEGAAADMIVLDYMSPTPLDSSNVYGHLLFGFGPSTVNTTIVNGKVLMKDRKINIIDEKQLSSECKRLSKRLWKRIN